MSLAVSRRSALGQRAAVAGGAFPTTGLLDDFNRANGAIGSGWTTPAFPSDGLLGVTGNQMYLTAGAQVWGSAWWLGGPYGADQEVFATYVVANAAVELLARLVTPGTTGIDGYLLDYADTATRWSIYRINNNTQTQVGSNVTSTLGFGEKIGFELKGNVLKGYKTTSGVWSQVISATDASGSAILTGGYIGMALNQFTVRVDDFGGGTVV